MTEFWSFEDEPQPTVFKSDKDDDTKVLWLKIMFIVLSFSEAIIAGFIPTWSTNCRENPKILGIANSFAGGVFLAIAFCHITPEMIEGWTDMNEGKKKIFPLPEVLIFCGYTIILVIDKVLFDTHALFDDDHGHGHGHDPAEHKLENNVRQSFAKADRAKAAGDVRKSMVEEKEGMEEAMKSYLNPHDRFATRMKASMSKNRDSA